MRLRWMMISLFACWDLLLGATPQVQAAVTFEAVLNNNAPSTTGQSSAFSVHNGSAASSGNFSMTTPVTTFTSGVINGMEVQGRGNSSAAAASAGGIVNNGSLGSKTTVGGTLNNSYAYNTPSNGAVTGGSAGMRVWQTDSIHVTGTAGGTTMIDLTVALDGFMELIGANVNDGASVTLNSTLIDSAGNRTSLLSFSTFLNRDPMAAPLFHSTSSSAGFSSTDWQNSFTQSGVTDRYDQLYSETVTNAFSVANNSTFQIENFLNTAASGTAVSNYFSSASFGYAPSSGSSSVLTSVPEPAACIPLLCGVIAFVTRRRRNRDVAIRDGKVSTC